MSKTTITLHGLDRMPLEPLQDRLTGIGWRVTINPKRLSGLMVLTAIADVDADESVWLEVDEYGQVTVMRLRDDHASRVELTDWLLEAIDMVRAYRNTAMP